MANYLTIKDLPVEERPREKLVKQGADKLSTAELLALMLRTGSQEKTALDLANEILLVCDGLRGISKSTIEQLQQIEGIGLAKSAQLKAVGELSKRISAANLNLTRISSPEEVAEILVPKLRDQPQEKFVSVLLNTKYEIISVQEIAKGTLDRSLVHPREVFRTAIKKNSKAVVIAHNHPSGDVTPSQEDIKITRRLQDAGDIVGIELVDHLIIGDNNYKSLKADDLL